MSELRKQLEQAKAQYEALRYPGDLAEQVCPPARPIAWRLRAGIALASAAGLAAMIAITMSRPPIADEGGAAPLPAPVAQMRATDLSIPGLPEMPAVSSLAFTNDDAISFTLPGMPAMPSIEDALSAAQGENEEMLEEAL